MGKIYVVGLGPGAVDALTLGAVERINKGCKNFLRTENHPTVEYFQDKDVQYESFDEIYDKEDDFQQVYKRIVDRLIEESANNEEINYFVPGNPFVAEKTVSLLMEEDLDIEIVSGMSFIEPMIELVGRDPIHGLKIVDGAVFNSSMIDINVDMIITQAYNARILSEIKITLSETYGDEYYLWLIHNAGVKGKEEIHHIPIYMLDRMENIGVLTSIYIEKIYEKDKKTFDYNDLMGIMRILRGVDGCQWDMEQTHRSIRECVIEEAYEVVDAIDRGDVENLIEELGDLLLQVLFHMEIAYEEGDFYPIEVTSALGNKLIYRHPHVFSKKTVENSNEIVYNWNELKDEQRGFATVTDKLKSLPKLPSLMKSFKIQEKVAEIGFDWDDIQGPLNKVMEEYEEVIEAMDQFGEGDERVEEELGDLFFSVVNLSRFLNINPEIALNRTINKFIFRFEIMEKISRQMDKDLKHMTLDEMNHLWNLAKENKNIL